MKLTHGLTKARQKFYSDMLFGISKSKHIFLSEIARGLKEDTDLKYTIKRLSRNNKDSDDLPQVHNNYLQTLRSSIPEYPSLKI